MKRSLSFTLGDYGLELYLLSRAARFHQALILVDWDCGFHYDRDEDHTPRFDLRLVLLNCTLVEFSVYNIHHVEESE